MSVSNQNFSIVSKSLDTAEQVSKFNKKIDNKVTSEDLFGNLLELPSFVPEFSPDIEGMASALENAKPKFDKVRFLKGVGFSDM